jgi:hypothetical protein
MKGKEREDRQQGGGREMDISRRTKAESGKWNTLSYAVYRLLYTGKGKIGKMEKKEEK